MVAEPASSLVVQMAAGPCVLKSAYGCKKVAESFGGLKKNAYLCRQDGLIHPGAL